MIHTFKFAPRFDPNSNYAVLGTVPKGRVLKSEPIFEDDGVYWLIVIDDDPKPVAPIEYYRR